LAQALRAQNPAGRHYFEVSSMADSERILAHIGLPNAQLVEKSYDRMNQGSASEE
jgi:hypothetical protein